MNVGWRLNVRPDSFTLSLGTRQVLSLDAEGRPLSWFREGTLYKRSLASVWLGRRQDGAERLRWTLPEAEAQALAEDWHATLTQAAQECPDPLLFHALTWTPQRLAAEAERYARAYAPVSILPPDQYYSVVVQATRGCSWNRCTFCTFYRDRPFTVQTLPEFQAHLEAVAELLGHSVSLRKSLFIADGNALMLSNAKLLPLLEAAIQAFPGRPMHGFLDVFTGTRKTVADWQALAAAGVRRVYLGLETGHAPLLEWLHKPGSPAQSVELISDLKAAGLHVGPIFMVGVGGQTYAAAHLEDTRRLLDQLPLGPGDLVYFSPFVPHGEYAQRAQASGVLPLGSTEQAEQETQLRLFLAKRHPAVKVARYDIREFIY